MDNTPTNGHINLKNLLNKNEYVNNTNNIRSLKHSTDIRDNIRALDTFIKSNQELKKQNYDDFVEQAKNKSPFLYNNYTDIFNKLINDELDLEVMTKLLIILKLIEDGKVDQMKGSVMAGEVLKEIYVDSAIKRGDKLDKQYNTDTIVEYNDISWKSYKLKNNMN